MPILWYTGVLLRAIEPVLNVEDRTNGPGLLSRAMGIDKSLNAKDLQSDNFYLAQASEEPPVEIVRTTRIGVHYAKEWATKPLRFYIRNNPYVSKR